MTKKHSIKMTREYLTLFFNIPEGYKVYDVISNPNYLELIVVQEDDKSHTHEQVDSMACLEVKDGNVFREQLVWHNWPKEN